MGLIIFTAGFLIGILLTAAAFEFIGDRNSDETEDFYHPDLKEREKLVEDLERAVDKYGLNK